MSQDTDKYDEILKQVNEAEAQVLREQAFSREAQPRFERNLAAFKQYFPEIFDEIQSFTTASPLELYVTESGHGNIKEATTKAPLYSQNPLRDAETQVNEAIQDPKITHIDFSHYANAPSDDQRLHMQFLRKLGSSIKSAGEYEKLTEMPSRFPTAVVFGVGLGYHLPLLSDRVQFDYWYIIEPQFENFYASLFCIDWATWIETIDEQHGVLVFHLGASYRDFIDDLYRVSQDIGPYSVTKCFCYQHYVNRETAELVNEFRTRLFEMHGGYGFYNDSTTALAHTVLNTQRGINSLRNGSEKRHPYSDVPVYIIGNGPSLDEAAQFLKDSQDKAIIVAAGTALKSLVNYGIRADFHVLIERPKITYDVLMHTLPVEYYRDLNLLTVNLIYPDAVDLYGWVGMAGKGVDAGGDLLNRVMNKQLRTTLRYLPLCNPMVSNTALSFVLSLGFKQVYLFGVDNGYAPDGRHHSAKSDYYSGTFNQWQPKPGVQYLPGNFGGKVQTSKLLAMSCRQMGRLLGMVPFADAHCYNVGDGARIEHATPVAIQNVLPDQVTFEKPEVVDFIKSRFDHFQFDDFESFIRLDHFERICVDLLTICQEPIHTRAEALDNLRRQARYLYSHRNTWLSHLHYVLEGELLYFHCPLITLLFINNDEKQCVEAFNRTLAVWIEFIETARQNFAKDWLEKCTMGWEPPSSNSA